MKLNRSQTPSTTLHTRHNILTPRRLLTQHQRTRQNRSTINLLLITNRLSHSIQNTTNSHHLSTLLMLTIPRLSRQLIIRTRPQCTTNFNNLSRQHHQKTRHPTLDRTSRLITHHQPFPILKRTPNQARTNQRRQTRRFRHRLTNLSTLFTLNVLMSSIMRPKLTNTTNTTRTSILTHRILRFSHSILRRIPRPNTLILTRPPSRTTKLTMQTTILNRHQRHNRRTVSRIQPRSPNQPLLRRTRIRHRSSRQRIHMSQ